MYVEELSEDVSQKELNCGTPKYDHFGGTLIEGVVGIFDAEALRANAEQIIADIGGHQVGGLRRAAGSMQAVQTVSNSSIVALVLCAGVAVVTGVSAAPLLPFLVGAGMISMFSGSVERVLRVEVAARSTDVRVFVENVEAAARLDAQQTFNLAMIVVGEVFQATVNFSQSRFVVNTLKGGKTLLLRGAASFDALSRAYGADLRTALGSVRLRSAEVQATLAGVTDAEQLLTKISQGDAALQRLMNMDPARAQQFLAVAKTESGRAALNQSFAEVKTIQSQLGGIVEKWGAQMQAQFDAKLVELSAATTVEGQQAVLQQMDELLNPHVLAGSLQKATVRALQDQKASDLY